MSIQGASSAANINGAALELWGGHECTVNRVHDAWLDQTVRGGHEDRPDDLTLFAELGLRKLRYPVLWERIAPRHPEQRDFRWTDERLPEIRRLGMGVIATLCHHGSGPHYTSLHDDGFAPGLAEHAAAVAARYPWIEDYTPVNEPLTTARFSALYGFWYPHQRDEGSFWRALLNEIDATRLAMRAIRAVNPRARLIQTDDLGYCHASPPLQAQADFENERRWIGWDLLCGAVVPGHAMWNHLASFGLADRLRAIADDPCPPDIVGVNHYLSSERLLDHRLELHGGRGLADRNIGTFNGVPHVDVDAVRNMPTEVIGLAGLVEQTWERYRIPVAVTECHNGSTRDEQARWFVDAWDACQSLRAKGVDVRALTAWSLLGSYDWNRMVTTTAGHYEPGVFDIRGGAPRPTLVAEVIRSLADGRRPHGPGLDVPGWWREERRAVWGEQRPAFAWGTLPLDQTRQRLAVVDDRTGLGQLVANACDVRGLHCLLVDDLSPETLRRARAWAIFDARESAGGLADLEAACRDHGVIGAAVRSHGFAEGAPVPPGIVIAETATLFDADAARGFEVELLDALDAGETVRVDARQDWNGVYAPSLVDGVLDLLLDRASGAVSFLPEQGWSRADVARALADVAGHEPCRIVDDGARCLGARAGLPAVSHLPSLEVVLERFVRDRRAGRRPLLRAQEDYLLEAAE